MSNPMLLRKLLREVIVEAAGDEDSGASAEAKQKGLQHMGWGRYGKDGTVTHTSKDGKLVPVQSAPDQGGGKPSAQPAAAPQPKPDDSMKMSKMVPPTDAPVSPMSKVAKANAAYGKGSFAPGSPERQALQQKNAAAHDTWKQQQAAKPSAQDRAEERVDRDYRTGNISSKADYESVLDNYLGQEYMVDEAIPQIDNIALDIDSAQFGGQQMPRRAQLAWNMLSGASRALSGESPDALAQELDTDFNLAQLDGEEARDPNAETNQDLYDKWLPAVKQLRSSLTKALQDNDNDPRFEYGLGYLDNAEAVLDYLGTSRKSRQAPPTNAAAPQGNVQTKKDFTSAGGTSPEWYRKHPSV